MKQAYICDIQIAPGAIVKKVTFKSFDETRKTIHKLISEHIDIDDCINDIRKGYNSDFRNAVADFLYTFFHNPGLIRSNDDIPSGNPNDYIENDVEYVENCCEANDEDDAEYYSKYNFKFEADSSRIDFRYVGDGEIKFDTIILYESDCNVKWSGDRVFSFLNWASKKSKKANDMIIKLDKDVVLGTSAYPVMVLKILQDNNDRPLSQAEIIEYVNRSYDVTIERKAVGRHLDMLKEIGYNIQKSKDGFWIQK